MFLIILRNTEQMRTPGVDLSSSSGSFSGSQPATTTTSFPETNGNGIGTAAAGKPKVEEQGEELVFRGDLQDKFAGVDKPIPTARQCATTSEALRVFNLPPAGFLAFLTSEKMEKADHPGILPSFVDEYEVMHAREGCLAPTSAHFVLTPSVVAGKCIKCQRTPELAQFEADRKKRSAGVLEGIRNLRPPTQ
jgi:hypothetical protein